MQSQEREEVHLKSVGTLVRRYDFLCRDLFFKACNGRRFPAYTPPPSTPHPTNQGRHGWEWKECNFTVFHSQRARARLYVFQGGMGDANSTTNHHQQQTRATGG